jgi:HD-like signal output (HDOD) protein
MHLDRLSVPLHDLSAWTARFRALEIPVLARTAAQLEELHRNEDAVDANLIGETVSRDPLMTLRVLRHAAANRAAKQLTDPETVTAAIVMMGIGPFFRAFGSPPATVETVLQDRPEALHGLQAVLRRAWRAANFALGFAVHRMDPDAALIHHAALLHDFAEMLLWCHAPDLALAIAREQHADATLRSDAVQARLLKVILVDLQQSLMRAWRLPEMLQCITDDRHAAQHAGAKSVMLAIRLARHTMHGWDNAALPDDVHDIARLLNLSDPAARHLLRELDE